MTWRKTGRYDQSSESCKPCNSSRGLKKSLPILADFIKKMGQFYKKFSCDKFGLLPSKQDEFHENAHFLSKK